VLDVLGGNAQSIAGCFRLQGPLRGLLHRLVDAVDFVRDLFAGRGRFGCVVGLACQFFDFKGDDGEAFAPSPRPAKPVLAYGRVQIGDFGLTLRG
jgi:hypothetical protein